MRHGAGRLVLAAVMEHPSTGGRRAAEMAEMAEMPQESAEL